MSLFPSVTYVEGGIDTGFTRVDREAFTTRLLHIKGRRNIRVSTVALSPKSMNIGDVFVLDAGRDIFQWNGKEASNVEKSKGLEITRKIRDEERGGKARLHIVEQGVDEVLFWEKFGCAPTKITCKGEDDATAVQTALEKVKLFHLSDASGKLVIAEITTRPLTPDLLLSDDAYIVDTGSEHCGIFVWIGKGASQGEKLNSMKYASEYLAKNKLPSFTPIVRVVEMAETPLFKQNFKNWLDPNASKPGQPAGQRKEYKKKAFDVKAMQARAEREKQRCVDDGSGKVEVWRIESKLLFFFVAFSSSSIFIFIHATWLPNGA